MSRNGLPLTGPGRSPGRRRAGVRAPASASSRAGGGTRRRRPAGPRPGRPAARRRDRRRPAGPPAGRARSAPTRPGRRRPRRRCRGRSPRPATAASSLKSSRFIETCARLELLDPEAVRLDLRQAAARFADPTGDPLGELEVGRIEVDVVGDEERTGTDGDGAGRRMETGRAEIGLAPGLGDLALEALVLAAPDIGQLDPLGSRGGVGVQEDRQVEARSRCARRTRGRARRSRPSSSPRAARTG